MDVGRIKAPLGNAVQEARQAYFAADGNQEKALLKLVDLLEKAQDQYDFILRTLPNDVAPISKALNDSKDVAGNMHEVKGNKRATDVKTGTIGAQQKPRFGVNR